MSSLKKSLGVDLSTLAEMIRSKGRSGDSILAHISPKEAALLKKRGGSGTTNPDTGLPEFYDGESYDIGFGPDAYTPEVQPADIQGTTFTPEQNAMYGYTDAGAAGAYDPMQAGQEGFAYPGAPGQQISPTQTAYTPTGAGMSGADIMAYQQGNYPTSPGATTPAGQEKGILDKLGISSKDALRLGVGATLAGGLTAQNIARTRQAGQQAQTAKGELSTMAAPYKEAGAKLTGAAERGELTPANQQALQAARAQVNQGIAQRGGVGAQQAANQIANLQALLLQNQYDYGIKISNIGDQYTLGAIKSGLEADRAIGAANQQFYGQLAQMIAPFITGVPNRIA
ncbi:MAG: hypothetical protein WCK82_15025 [Bacteroidota bacterium]